MKQPVQLSQTNEKSFCFFFYKIKEQEGGTGSAWWVGEVQLAPVGGIGWWGRSRRRNMVQTVYTHVCKQKNETH
jgi:hypothetical protein